MYLYNMANETTAEGNERFTLFAKSTNIYKLDYITKVEFINKGSKVTRTDLVNQAIDEFIAKYEKKNKKIPAKK